MDVDEIDAELRVVEALLARMRRMRAQRRMTNAAERFYRDLLREESRLVAEKHGVLKRALDPRRVSL